MSSTPIHPRPLTDLESVVLTELLSVGGAGADEFRAQIPDSEVVATWGAGSPSVDLAVRGGVQAVTSTDGIFANATVTDNSGSPIGELILWVENGWLSAIEYGWYTDERPRCLPEPARITVH
ncbi:hypothetical protein [Nocardia sp. NPDC058666]|uniref:hypothetical protein n=1 Tax=Nocardia sp. NPDC058666 TaxID=3346587 RepID=UPI0036463ACC